MFKNTENFHLVFLFEHTVGAMQRNEKKIWFHDGVELQKVFSKVGCDFPALVYSFVVFYLLHSITVYTLFVAG